MTPEQKLEQRLRAIERTVDILARHQLSIAKNFDDLLEQFEQEINDHSFIKQSINQDINLLQQVKPLSKQ